MSHNNSEENSRSQEELPRQIVYLLYIVIADSWYNLYITIPYVAYIFVALSILDLNPPWKSSAYEVIWIKYV